MQQALHIFKKDVRHLWLDIRVGLSVIVAFGFTGAHRPENSRSAAWTLVLVLLPITWWVIIARLVHDEPIPGDRQFWITRPYSWASLISAKCLFILAFINLPMLIADTVVLRAYGLHVGTNVPGLMWSQVLLTVFVLLPMVTLSSLTTGFVQLIFAILMPCVVALVIAIVAPDVFLGGFWGPSEWVKTYYAFLVTAAAAPVILIWQYSQRRTTIGRALTIAACILVIAGFALIPWTAAFAIQSWSSKESVPPSAIQVSFDSNDHSTHPVMQRDGRVRIVVPLRISGVPDRASLSPEGFSIELKAPDGTVQRAAELPLMYGRQMGAEFPLQTTIDGAFYGQFKDQALQVHGQLYFTVFGNPQSIHVPFTNKTVPVLRIGACSASQALTRRTAMMVCSSAFREPPILVSYQFLESMDGISVVTESQPRMISYSPFPADLGLDPVHQEIITSTFAPSSLSEARIDSLQPLAYIRRDFVIDKLTLGSPEAGITKAPEGGLVQRNSQIGKSRSQKPL